MLFCQKPPLLLLSVVLEKPVKLFKEIAATRGNCTAGGQEEEEAMEQEQEEPQVSAV